MGCCEGRHQDKGACRGKVQGFRVYSGDGVKRGRGYSPSVVWRSGVLSAENFVHLICAEVLLIN